MKCKCNRTYKNEIAIDVDPMNRTRLCLSGLSDRYLDNEGLACIISAGYVKNSVFAHLDNGALACIILKTWENDRTW